MKWLKLHIVLAVLTTVLLSACEPTVPKEYIQPADMENIIYDFYVAKGMSQLPDHEYDKRDYYQELYFDAVLKKHDVQRADFDSSLVYYYTRADRFVKICKNVQDRLADEAVKYGASAGDIERFTASSSQNGDTANIWNGAHRYILFPYAPYNRYQFHLAADTTFRQGDSFMLTFSSNFFYQSGSKDAVAYMMVKYENDSIASSVNHFSVTGYTSLRLSPCDLKVKEINGFLYLGKGYEQTSSLRILFLDNIQLIRFHKTKETAPEVQTVDGLSKSDDVLEQPSDTLSGKTNKPRLLTPKPITKN